MSRRGPSLTLITAGAGAVAFLDAFASPAFAGSALRRELLLVGGAGHLAAAFALWLLLLCTQRWLPRTATAPASCLFLGGSLAATPAVFAWADTPLGAAAALAGLAVFAIAVGSLVRFPSSLGRGLLAIEAVAAAILFLRSPSLQPELPSHSRELRAGPDLVLVSIDTLRADALESACVATLKRLRETGTWAPYALAPSPLTLPSHVTMLSGVPIYQHGVLDNHSALPEQLTLLSERLFRAGYRTAAVSSNWLLRGEAGFARGYEVYAEAPTVHGGPLEQFERRLGRGTWWGWLGWDRSLHRMAAPVLHGRPLPTGDANRGNGQRTTEAALRLLSQLQEEEAPFFLFVHYMDPHTPYAPPPGAQGPCGGERPEVATAPLEPGDWRSVMELRVELARDAPGAEERLERVRALYDAEVRFVDASLASLLTRIEAAGRETVLLVTADHGEQFGDHGHMTHGNSLYESALRVPFIVAGAGVPGQRLRHAPQLIDVAPTLLARAGLASGELLGVDVVHESPGDRPHFAAGAVQYAYRSRGWKLLLDGHTPEPESLELYRIRQDPGELRSRLDERPQLVAQLAGLARKIAARAGPLASPPQLEPETRETLRALGYVGD